MTHWAIKGLVRYVQSGTHAELCGTLFTSNLRETKADIIYNSRLKPSQDSITSKKPAVPEICITMLVFSSLCVCVCVSRLKGGNSDSQSRKLSWFCLAALPCNFDHFGPEGFDVLQESLHRLSGAYNALWGWGGRCRNWTEKVITWQWGKKRTKTQFFFLWTRSDTETKCSQCHTVLKLRNCLQAFTRNYLNSLKRGI